MKLKVIAITSILLFGAAASASSADLGCKTDFWGDVVCSADGLEDEVKIRDTFWGDKEVVKEGKVVARCKQDIWGYTICK